MSSRINETGDRSHSNPRSYQQQKKSAAEKRAELESKVLPLSNTIRDVYVPHEEAAESPTSYSQEPCIKKLLYKRDSDHTTAN